MNQGFRSTYPRTAPAQHAAPRKQQSTARPVVVDGIEYTYKERTDAKYTFSDAHGIACSIANDRGWLAPQAPHYFSSSQERLTTVELNRVVADLLYA